MVKYVLHFSTCHERLSGRCQCLRQLEVDGDHQRGAPLLRNHVALHALPAGAHRAGNLIGFCLAADVLLLLASLTTAPQSLGASWRSSAPFPRRGALIAELTAAKKAQGAFFAASVRPMVPNSIRCLAGTMRRKRRLASRQPSHQAESFAVMSLCAPV